MSRMEDVLEKNTRARRLLRERRVKLKLCG